MRDKVFRIIYSSIPEPGRRNLVEAYINALERELDRARERAITDDLTGLDHRNSFDVALKRMISRSLRIQSSPTLGKKPKSILTCITRGWEYPICCVMTDIDHFKKVNDTYGHQTGDAALRFFAKFLQTELSETDAVGRFGGEEFILGLEGASHEGAWKKLDEMRRKIKTQTVTNDLSLKFSSGICSSEHVPEIIFLYSKKLLSTVRDHIKGNNVSKQVSDIAKKLKKSPKTVDKMLRNIIETGNEFIDKGFKGTLSDVVTHYRSDFACFLFEHRADLALYQAKQTGRDKVCVWTPKGIVDKISG